jgi:hypothetical protein
MSSREAERRGGARGGRRSSLLRCRTLGCALLLFASLASRARAQQPASASSAGAEHESARPNDEHGVPAQAKDTRSEEVRLADARSQGYLESLLERELAIPRAEYALSVREGIAYLALYGARRVEHAAALDRIGAVPGIARFELSFAEQAPKEPPSAVAEGLGLAESEEPLPVGDPFLPLIADPKTPQFFASVRHYETPRQETTGAAVGFGEVFGLWRRGGKREGDGLQLSLSAGIFALFDLESESSDLINADYMIGFPLTWRRGDTSARLRLYHQSSHLGDEFLLEAQPERINLSFESLELIFSREWGPVRAYGGGEYLVHRDPSDLDPWGAHGGLEYRGTERVFGIGRPVAALDLKSWQEHDGAVDWSAVAGFELGRFASSRSVRVMLEAYHGFSPHGQFYEDEISYFGLGLALGF